MNHFVPLGGGNEVGASCYFVEIDGYKILLDCGKRINNKEVLPNFSYLLENEIDSFEEIDFCIISHAHYDHIAAIPALTNMFPNIKYLSTEITFKVTKVQLHNFIANEQISSNLKKKMLEIIDQSLINFETIPVKKTYLYKDLKVTFFPAGHMPGAVMTLLETKKHKILYTGDFTICGLSEINKFAYDGPVKSLDALIMTGTHAYNKKETINQAYLYKKIYLGLSSSKNILIVNRAVGKFIDLIYVLKSMNLEIPIYLDSSKSELANRFEDTGFVVYDSQIKRDSNFNDGEKHILIADSNRYFGNYFVIDSDKYTAHPNYIELEAFAKIFSDVKIFLVHTSPNKGENIIDDLKESIKIEQCENYKEYTF